MKGRLKQLTGTLLALLLCVSLAAPAAAANPGVNDIATAALELISSHEGTYNSVNANDSGAVSVGKIQWHGERAHEVVRLAATYLGASNAIAILGQSLYDEVMSSVRWDSRSMNSVEAAAVSKLLDTEAGHRAEDEIGARDLSAYVRQGMSIGLADPSTLVYFCDLYNQWPVKANEIARTTVATYGAYATVDKIHEIASNSPMAGILRTRAIAYCSNIRWDGYGPSVTTDPQPTTPVNPTGFSDVAAGSWYADSVKWAVDQGITNGTGDKTFSPETVCTRAQAVTFLWRAMGSLEPTTTVKLFNDVNPGDYYYKAVLWAAEQGITTGTSEGTFSPNRQCTRGEIVTFLWRAKGSPAASGASFADVSADSFCATAVCWAYAEGITTGTDANNFSPNSACTRAHIVTFLYRDMA